jgi:CRISPR-associated protein Cmr5
MPIENGRAKFAYDRAKENVNNQNIENSEYKSYVKKLPQMIKTNGLGATLAFVFSKKNSTYKAVADDIRLWLEKNKGFGLIDMNGVDDLQKFVDSIIELDSSKYRALTIEVLSFLNWLRRFADGLIKEQEE